MEQETQKLHPPYPHKVRGTATIHDDDTIEFRPQGRGEPVKDVISTFKGSSLYTTTGANPKLVAHLVADAADPDRYGYQYEVLDRFIGKLTAPVKQGKRRPKCKVLYNNNGLTITVGTDDVIVIGMTISLLTHPDYTEHMFNLFTETNKCLAYNKNFLRQRLSALSTSGKE